MTHAGYILSAYLISAIVLIALVVAMAADLRRQKRALARLDAAGSRRRGGAS